MEDITKEKAIKVLKEEQKERIEKCKEKIGEILKEYKCGLDCLMIVTANGNIPRIEVVVLE
jgi:hypothetical protein